MVRGLSRRGFTLMEVLVGMLFVLAAGTLLPSFSQNLAIGDVLWERRLAMRFIDDRLDKMCMQAKKVGFNGGVMPFLTDQTAADGSTIPTGLIAGTWTQTVLCLDGNTDPMGSQAADTATGACPSAQTLKQVQVTVKWKSRNRDMTLLSGNYLISTTGLCR